MTVSHELSRVKEPKSVHRGRSRRRPGREASQAENAAPVDAPAVFVTRLCDGRFGWQVRRFGALVIQQSDVAYPTPIAARSAGERALSEA